ncbi:DUF2513 domain-containing protein [Hazenella sp. IB182357]|uniref:DUF2513 domain-containing protein n=1 Tax=Polycladospora coralii TaxID=2771432 RepID=A0A926RVE3_9BACL|nr:DUF2513 domain-containing protein [Polycladospora coralii]MBD1373727.1 DUF2513 domain-containing protein [Polycladospora coralii]
MHRDIKLIRSILTKLEESTEGVFLNSFDFEDFTNEEVEYHFILLHQAKMIDTIHGRPTTLTWDGYEYLDIIRIPFIRDVIDRNGLLPFDVLKEIAMDRIGIS